VYNNGIMWYIFVNKGRKKKLSKWLGVYESVGNGGESENRFKKIIVR